MPRFFFHDTGQADREGVDLPDRKAARDEAIRAAAEILKDIDGAFSGKQWVMTVEDEAGNFVLELTFSLREQI